MEVISRAASEFMPATEIWRVRSKQVGDEFQICVTAPLGTLLPDTRAGAVYALDGNISAGINASMLAMLGLGGEVPPLFAISIGYPLDHAMSPLGLRHRDLTPTAVPVLDPALAALHGLSEVMPSGGGDAFLAFLLDELRPALEQAYPLDPTHALLTGTSLGGLFTLHALLRKPSGFNRYLAISPSIWWDDHEIVRRARATEPLDTGTGALHLYAGQLEGLPHIRKKMASLPPTVQAMIPSFMKDIDMLDDMKDMQAALTGKVREFDIVATVLPMESHTSVMGAAFSHGLRSVYGTLPARLSSDMPKAP